MRAPVSWWRRFGLHLAAAVGATGIFVAAAAVGAHQQGATAAAPVIVRTVRPLRSPTAAAIARQGPTRTATGAPAQERSLAGTVMAVEADDIVLLTAQGREWRVTPAPGALLRLDGKSIHGVDALQPDDRVVVLGVAQARDRFMAHAITARRPRA